MKVDGWSTAQEKGWGTVQGGWSLYSARRRLEHGAGGRLEYGTSGRLQDSSSGRLEYFTLLGKARVRCRWKATSQHRKAEVQYFTVLVEG